ncbi:DUF4442 domain-containing protein [Cyclobacterium amurskyense]|uniref:Thioesterase n=1 Tax=Cyclobacterium amurskyense TaxID=320787 RepID=A0A0H4PEH6_9BACT|nr:DUF4442 domain-containing protein [Cyclobacterium amurskyense]AKP52669.1 hypothetical protein CA2015_3276 [Cyclobacterium amurskyense]
MNKNQQRFINYMSRFVTYTWYMLGNLPSVVFWGVRIKKINMDSCQTTIPYNWRTKNPFKSIYFATLCGGAELASGSLCLLHLTGSEKFSMLVVDLNAQFVKKADAEITMQCEDGHLIQQTLSGLAQPGDTSTLKTTIIGHNPNNEIVAKFEVTWSFKRK